MANIKDSFSKGITALNVKTNNFMEENKCKTYITTLESEIRDLKLELGSTIYQKWLTGPVDLNESVPVLTQIKEKYAEIEHQKQKIEQLQLEEKQILGSQTAPSDNKKFCGQCGAPNDMHYKFCCKCGAPFV